MGLRPAATTSKQMVQILHANSSEADSGWAMKARPLGSRDYIAKRKPRKLLLSDILLQDDFEDSNVDSSESDKI